jgi:hypothetical protein
MYDRTSRVRRAFGHTTGFLPRAEYSDGKDFPHSEASAALMIDSTGRTPPKVLVKEAWFSTADEIQRTWALCEEMAHYLHFVANPDLFAESFALHSKPRDPKEQLRLLETKNIIEFMGRAGGFYGGVVPNDFNQTLAAYHQICSTSGATSPEELDLQLRADPRFKEDLLVVAMRVWGTTVADKLVGIDKGFLPSYEFLRTVAKASAFEQIGDRIVEYYPSSEIGHITRKIADQRFGKYKKSA